MLSYIDPSSQNKNPLYGYHKNMQNQFTEYTFSSTKDNLTSLNNTQKGDFNGNKIVHNSKPSSRKYPILREAKYTAQKFVNQNKVISSINKTTSGPSWTTMSSKKESIGRKLTHHSRLSNASKWLSQLDWMFTFKLL